MTTELRTTTEGPVAVDTVAASAPFVDVSRRAWEHFEAALVWLGDRLNPILVKETRQALKSRQFSLTFLLVLVACWIVTMFGVALIGPGIFYSASGSSLLFAYFVVLAFPLLIAVPYTAYRSLAAEREDNTFDVLSITTLKPRQIISGKLGSAIAQMAVYFSAVTPCLAFTYLLRGVDLPTIFVLLLYVFFASFGLSMIGLLLATLSKQRYSQVFVSVLFIAGLFFSFIYGCVAAGALIATSYTFVANSDFWIGTAMALTAWATFFALFYFAAAGMLTFASENRATPLRIVMVIQQACWLGWMGAIWFVESYQMGVILAALTILGIYWFTMGAMMTAEKPQLSLRVQRRLPQSTLARMLFTWFNPGPAAGYMFVVANTTALAILLFLGGLLSSVVNPRTGWPSSWDAICTSLVGWGYLVIYLGLGLLAIRGLRRVATVTMPAAVLIQILLVFAGSGIPASIQWMSVELRELDYSYLQITNPIWTMVYLVDRGLPSDAVVILLFVSTAAICVFLLNIPGILREMHLTRVAAPDRVVADDLELNPPPAALPQNPWEADPAP